MRNRREEAGEGSSGDHDHEGCMKERESNRNLLALLCSFLSILFS